MRPASSILIPAEEAPVIVEAVEDGALAESGSGNDILGGNAYATENGFVGGVVEVSLVEERSHRLRSGHIREHRL